MRDFLVADVETTPLTPGLRPRTLFWGVSDGASYWRFETTAELWRWLADRGGLVYCHHDYDMLQALSDGMPLLPTEVRGGRILRARGPEGVEWRNSHALFPSSLAEILASCGFVKPGLGDLEERNRADTLSAHAAFRMIGEAFYSATGVEILAERPLTAASAAFSAAELVAGELPRVLMDREFYRGGRVEAFQIGAVGEAEQWDVTSSYPFAFLSVPERDTLCYAEVTVDTDGPCPFFALGEEKLLFPRGRFRTAFLASSYERWVKPHGGIRSVRILEAIPLDCGWLRRVGDGLILPAFQRRALAQEEGNAALAYALKIALNSVYGRLGLKAQREICVVSDRVAAGEVVDIAGRLPDGRIVSFRQIPSKPKANYHFAAAITCNARARLYDGLMRAGEPFYCDTDSVFARPGALREIESPGLGGWQSEGVAELYIHGAKDYVWGNTVKLKGGAEYFRWTLRALSAGRPVAQVVRHRFSEYDKRIVLPGGRTIPVDFGA